MDDALERLDRTLMVKHVDEEDQATAAALAELLLAKAEKAGTQAAGDSVWRAHKVLAEVSQIGLWGVGENGLLYGEDPGGGRGEGASDAKSGAKRGAKPPEKAPGVRAQAGSPGPGPRPLGGWQQSPHRGSPGRGSTRAVGGVLT
mmetsp:Transcript_64634/g.145798  ORF Transcript_64634/g.145798 Transcript_64634/m.145798 type:complete len:145 (-) Transcript_64634:26-460(-)